MLAGVGFLAHSGKDTVANYLCAYHGFVRFGFADPLKESLKPIFGLTDDHCYGSLKEAPLPFWTEKFGHEVTPRWLFQYYGTEVMRAWQPQIWVWANEQFVRECLASGENVVFSDVRFPNEAHSVHEWGGKVFEIVRPSLPEIKGGIDSHASEVTMQSYDKWDGQIINLVSSEWEYNLYRNAEKVLGLPMKALRWVNEGRPTIPAAPSRVRRFLSDQNEGVTAEWDNFMSGAMVQGAAR